MTTASIGGARGSISHWRQYAPHRHTVVSYCLVVPSLQAWERSSVEPCDKPVFPRVDLIKESLKETTLYEEDVVAVDSPGSDSGFQDTKVSTWWFNLLANRSTRGIKNCWVSFRNKTGDKLHSVLSSKCQDLKSATVLSEPGTYAADNQIFLWVAHCQMLLAISLHIKEWVPPILFIYIVAVVLSNMSRMCISVWGAPKAWGVRSFMQFQGIYMVRHFSLTPPPCVQKGLYYFWWKCLRNKKTTNFQFEDN